MMMVVVVMVVVMVVMVMVVVAAVGIIYALLGPKILIAGAPQVFGCRLLHHGRHQLA